MTSSQQVCYAPQPGPQERFVNTPPDVHICFYGGAAGGGKTYALLLDVLKYKDDPNFYGVFFRRNTKQIERGLWPEALEMYMPFLVYQSGTKKGKFIGKAKINQQGHKITFPSGALIEFSHLEYDSNAVMDWQGTQLSAVYWDRTCPRL